jgi:hypothetical protein
MLIEVTKEVEPREKLKLKTVGLFFRSWQD